MSHRFALQKRKRMKTIDIDLDSHSRPPLGAYKTLTQFKEQHGREATSPSINVSLLQALRVRSLASWSVGHVAWSPFPFSSHVPKRNGPWVSELRCSSDPEQRNISAWRHFAAWIIYRPKSSRDRSYVGRQRSEWEKNVLMLTSFPENSIVMTL